jgi:hypothetical protein
VADAFGSATIVVQATDSGALTVNDTFVVTVTPVNDQPIVVSAVPDTTVIENNPPFTYRDLNDVFDDVEDSGSLVFTVESNDNPGLVTATTGDGGGVAFRSVSTAVSDGNAVSVDVNTPVGTVAGDLLIASLTSDGNSTLSPPDGSWTLIEGGGVNPSSGTTPSFGVWYKIAGGSEPSLYTFTSSASERLYMTVQRYDGHDATSPINASALASSAGSTTPTAPTVTTTVDGAKILRVFGADGSSAPYVVPAGHTERYNGLSGGGPAGTGGAGAEINQTTAGATGTAAFSMSASEEWQAVTVAIAPASAGGDSLSLTFAADSSGSAAIVVRATDSGALFVEDEFIVTVTADNDAPVIASAIPDTTVAEDSPAITAYRDLNDVFSDIEDGTALAFTIFDNDNPGLIDPTINGVDSTLDLSLVADAFGSATIVIRATDSGALTVNDTFVVTARRSWPFET